MEESFEQVDFQLNPSLNFSHQEIASHIRDAFDLEIDWHLSYNKYSQAFNYLRDCVEHNQVVVFVNSIVANSPNRKLSREEFRGFCLYDDYAPLIFINSRDSESAIIFTLLHELVHLVLQSDALVEFPESFASDKSIESLCNRTAAELLMPRELFSTFWMIYKNQRNQTPYEIIGQISKKLHCSRTAAAIRARQFRLISEDVKQNLIQKFKSEFNNYLREKRARQKTSKGGPDFIVLQNRRVGLSFAKYVETALYNDQITYTEASRLTNLNISTFNKYLSKYS